MKAANLFDFSILAGAEEHLKTLLQHPHFRLEEIVSLGHITPEGQWYDQEQFEWVVLLSGAARLRFEGDAADLEFKPGDFCNIPPHCRHRVTWTKPDEPTVWLAIHYGN